MNFFFFFFTAQIARVERASESSFDRERGPKSNLSFFEAKVSALLPSFPADRCLLFFEIPFSCSLIPTSFLSKVKSLNRRANHLLFLLPLVVGVAAAMWVEILCGLVAYKLIRTVFFSDDGLDHLADLDCSHSDLCFAVASRLEKLYGGRCFVGLRIPDPDAGARQHVDVVLVTKREVMVVAINNLSGFVEVDKDGNWSSDKKRKQEVFSNPVLEVNRVAANLQSYLEQRGATLPNGYVSGRVVLPNPNCRPSYTIALQPEVISYDQWKDLKADTKGGLSTWIKGAFHGSKSDIQESLLQNLHSILSTSPMWDRLELRGDKNVLGEFIEFKGRHDDIQLLKKLKRSKVSRFIIQKSTLFGGFGRSRVQILYSPRDYRAEGASSSEWKEISVKQYTEILFQPLHSKKLKKFKLSSVASVTLSA